jgi:phosphohistidine phosphatase
MIVYFLRHASAGQSKKDPVADEKRPLDKDGIDQCRYVGRALAVMDVQVDAIISSPLKRATQTASLVGNEIGHEAKLQLTPALRPDASYENFRRMLDGYANRDAVMVVGHNPTLSQFVSLMISDGANEDAVDLKKAAVAKIEFDRRRPAVLDWCLTPRLVRAVYETVATSSRPKSSRK